MKKFLTILIGILLFTVAGAQPVMIDTAQDRYIKIDDVKLHYKMWGKGEPVLLLHGAMEYWRSWKNQIPVLAKNHKVIVVDTRGHGESTFTDRELSYDLFANDMNQFITLLGYDSINVVGFGDGAIIGMMMAIRRPGSVKRLVAIGSNLKADTTAVYPDVLEKVKQWDYEKMAFYLQVKFKENPNPLQLKEMARRMQKLLLTQPNMNYDDLDKVICPTLVMAGDRDLIKPMHTQFIFENLPIGQLCIIPGATHYCISEKPSIVNVAINDFLQLPQHPVKR
ncbi:MAG: alpha/beta hydrolase [Chitinophagales bacterium]